MQRTYTFRFPGRPEHRIEEIPTPPSAILSLLHPCGEFLTPRVQPGAAVRAGTVIAANSNDTCLLTAPVAGKVALVEENRGTRRKPKPGKIVIDTQAEDNFEVIEGANETPERISIEGARRMLVRAGIWPLIRELPTSGKLPTLDKDPSAVVVKAVKSEPFMPRGNVVLENRVDEFDRALAMLQRVVGGFARIHFVVTAEQHPLAREIKKQTAGKAWLRLHFLPVAYPVENDLFLFNTLLPEENRKEDFRAWFLDEQAVLAIGACLRQGKPYVERIIALGGSAYKNPVHAKIRIGTPVEQIVQGRLADAEIRLIRGGLLRGSTIEETHSQAVGPADDAITAVIENRERALLSFIRPGRNTDSYSRTFLSFLFPRLTKSLHTNLRGEARRCVACGFCEEMCPAEIMPHLLDKYITHEMLEEAEAAGLELCMDCGLCSYVCPSKIEILSHLLGAKRKIEYEKAKLQR